MNKLKLLTFWLLLGTIIVACGGGSDDDPIEPPTPTTDPTNPTQDPDTTSVPAYLKLEGGRTEYGLSARGGTVAFFLETNCPNYTLKSDVDWCHPEAKSKEVWVTFDYWEDNSAEQCREGHVIFYNGTTELCRLLVWQDARYATFELDHLIYPYKVSPAGGKYYLFVVKNTFRQWKLEASDDWFTVEPSGKDGILINVKPRSADMSTPREGFMIVTFNDDQRQRFKIYDGDIDSSVSGEEPGYGEHTDWDN